MRKLITLIGLALALSACGKTVQERIVTVNVPIIQPCLGPLPTAVQPLKKRYTSSQWRDMDIKQKSAAIGVWAYSLDTYSKEQEVAYKGCKSID